MHSSRLLIFAALLAAPLAAAADASRDVLTLKNATVGFAGKFKAGFWQPVRLTVAAGPEGARGRLELVAPDGDQTPAVYRDESLGVVDLAPGEETAIRLYCKSGPIGAPISVRLIRDGEVIWSR